ncbi:replication protein [Salmonella enterica subsp. enterica serovar Miami]|nr:replication protein [Salmonella enterica subsp. enterica serovar Miami]
MLQQYNSENFISQISARPFCTDNFKLDGIYRLNKPKALGKIYIEHNNESFINSIVFDIDDDMGAVAWDMAGVPIPNVITQNPANGHAHLFYALASPVCITEKAHKKPQKLLKGVIAGLTDRLGADPCYTGKITKNPLNPQWRTFWNNTEPYELNFLRDFIAEKRLPTKTIVRKTLTEGRNSTLFDLLRLYAYGIVFRYQKAEDYSGFMSALEERATMINDDFSHGLCHKEIWHTVKSITNWTWDNFDHERFSEIQSIRGSRPKKNGRKQSEINKMLDFLGGGK